MFRHHGKNRTLSDNLKIASLLSFVAGIVNVAGYLSIKKLTTNVTGHFAFFVDEVLKLDLYESIIYFLYIVFFFLGSFCSSILIELTVKKTSKNIFALPILFESFMLFFIGIFGAFIIDSYPDSIAFSLLFAMGLQNSLVTRISNATVRTTHLTGLFTDLGIELSQLFFYKNEQQTIKLKSNIRLRLRIISFFFIGGIAGGVLFVKMHLAVLIIAAVTLIFGLLYDNIKYRMIHIKRRYHK